jgi:hypothetical protein
MDIRAEQHQFAKIIHEHVIRYPDSENGLEQILPTIYDYMEAFKALMDSTTQVEMNYLCQQYPGLYRFGKILEMLAEGIADGRIDVPKDH